MRLFWAQWLAENDPGYLRPINTFPAIDVIFRQSLGPKTSEKVAEITRDRSIAYIKH